MAESYTSTAIRRKYIRAVVVRLEDDKSGGAVEPSGTPDYQERSEAKTDQRWPTG